MKKVCGCSYTVFFFLMIMILTSVIPLSAQDSGFKVSGILDSSVTAGAGTGDAPDFFIGIEEYANLRIQARIRDRAVFYGAFNFIAASGTSAQAASAMGALNTAAGWGLAGSAYVAGENYIAAMELERLYFRLNGKYIDAEAGLMRLAFGYGQVFGPTDFLNPRNPLVPDARPRAILGGALYYYPADTGKIFAFGAAPRDPFTSNGGGARVGLSGDWHWDRASIQALYAFETPHDEADQGIHRMGLSLKADVEVGITADMLYTYNREAGTGIEGLAAAAGIDYSFWEGRFYVLAEYLYSGSASSTSTDNGNLGGFSRQNYLFAQILYRFSEYTNVSLGCLSSFDDISFTPILGASHELFQGFNLDLSCRVPLDRSVFQDNGERGTLGPLPPGAGEGSRFAFTLKARLRF
ncbi:hypothetical protein AGMMS49579_00640 [Spirochaetia bacterium]|nr:hypothetical protein AGMMS49579_00250 [Spirochaetia bacterium]GHV49331.1 hypothetical protein AGMMS49579_00640 [Spirochaetia bacterium]